LLKGETVYLPEDIFIALDGWLPSAGNKEEGA
jgi:hypothetical protein